MSAADANALSKAASSRVRKQRQLLVPAGTADNR